jgi:AraC-like DNA-binding protein
LGVDAATLYHYTEICDRISEHNQRYPVSISEAIEAKLNELREQANTMTAEELANFFGYSERHFYKHYSEYLSRLTEQNRMIQIDRERERAEKYLQELINTQTGQDTRRFGRHVGIDIKSLRQRHPDILIRLKQLNKAVGLHGTWSHSSREERVAKIYAYWNRAIKSGEFLSLEELSERCHFTPATIRLLCPEIVEQIVESPEGKLKREEEALSIAFTEIVRSNQVRTLKYFAAAANIPENAMRTRFRHWNERLSEHNAAVVSARLQDAWNRMVDSKEVWTIVRFAQEAEMNYETLHVKHKDWFERFHTWKAQRSILEGTSTKIAETKC